MNNLTIEATKRTPAVNFDFQNHSLSFSGESYPEDSSQFYGEIISALSDYLDEINDQAVQVTFDLIYFNSSSAKAMMRIFDMFDVAAEKNNIIVSWLYEEDDDNLAELGEEFGEDLKNATFKLTVKSTSEE